MMVLRWSSLHPKVNKAFLSIYVDRVLGKGLTMGITAVGLMSSVGSNGRVQVCVSKFQSLFCFFFSTFCIYSF